MEQAKDPTDPSTRLPVVLCGDFNLEPFSALYQFLSTGSLHVPGLNRTMMSGQHDFDNPAAHVRAMPLIAGAMSAGLVHLLKNMSLYVSEQKAKFVNENDTRRHLGTGTAQGRFDASRRGNRPTPRAFRVDVAASHDVSSRVVME